ncbi:MAG: ATP-binding cassette domain-containing protein [Candidatus Eremiobacteraeota bacterium]|nr:ATP-binding cassette domain-containing protein [Candidatus Eremiobacteraeota bacterium]
MLKVEHVRKDFGGVHAVSDVSFEIPRGITFGLLGPNGAGKTTTMRMILGIYTPDGGAVSWDDKHIDGSMRRRFGYLPEERGLYGKMKAREQIAYFGRLHGMTEPTITQRTQAWIEQLGLEEYAERPCGELSKGNQQKVQVACAAVHEPELLILDEPFSGLDPVNAEMLLNAFNDLKKRGTTLVLSSHQMWQLEVLCSQFCIITGGKNRIGGTLAELRSAWPTRLVRVQPNSPAVRDILERIPGAHAVAAEDGSLDYQVPADTRYAEVLRSLVAAEAITKFDAVEPSLQDIYIHTIERAA